LAGKHAARRSPGVRYLVPAVAAMVVGASLVGIPAATGWLDRRPAGDNVAVADPPLPSTAESAPSLLPPTTDDVAVSPDPSSSPAPSPKVTRTPRGTVQRGTRPPSPRPSPAPRRSPTMAPAAAAANTCGVSFYDTGAVTASGEPFDPGDYTAAHPTLAFDTQVRVTNPANGWSIVVRINDRGPYAPGRCLDLTPAAFSEIAPLSAGVIQAKYEVLG
jgi:rare lipoprotein A